ncbi:Proline-serine-threonine phosphatase-interacting protein 1 [Holothuria leucospilota]|uniref:Proline-serine-threonine phosphatase-interacting protein 1 n=1 Tax=Holothuria leucospilota TaxID=206669 RepID=A0A9Q1BZU6_HOLLE|nr:Proline-serine-threonine phosphatase-interacting protein 1 [Holothuria leucospilota]
MEITQDRDIVGTVGFEALVKRLKEGNNVCKEIEDFLKSRGLRESWDEFVKQTENEAQLHTRLGTHLATVAKKIEEFRMDQKQRRSKLEDNVKQLQNHKKECYQKVMTLKERYENKCKEADMIEDVYTREEPTLPPAKKTAVNEVYKKSVQTLEDSRTSWETSMTKFCHEAQTLEEERIHFLRNEMWVVTNHVSENCVSVDNVQEEVRKVLEKCLAEKDLNLFVQQKRTGNKRPEPVWYESYYQDERISRNHLLNGTSYNNVGSSTGHPNLHREPLPSVPTASPGRLPSEDNDIYASVPEDYQGNASSSAAHQHTQQTPLKAKVAFSYKAQGDDEISVEVGQIVSVLSSDDNNWWFVEYGNQQGNVPSRYLEPVKKILV